jgi:hypothetical protein
MNGIYSICVPREFIFVHTVQGWRAGGADLKSCLSILAVIMVYATLAWIWYQTSMK